MVHKRIRDYGIIIGNMKPGTNNLITDVKGIKVGHVTLNMNNIKTGVTAILPHEENIFKEKVPAACHVINGFGKTIGTVQIEELGTLETPIILTNTLSVGTVCDALVEYMLSENEDIGNTTGTVNSVVCECNDGFLNDIRGRHVKKEHVFQSIENAKIIFEEGAVGAGTGMSCYGLKGGIGSASRLVELNETTYTIGALVLSNFGAKEDLIVNGIKAGKTIWNSPFENEPDKGSIIVVLATDIPMSHRQLKRMAKRAQVGISRTGSFNGNGSGDIVICFSTANRIKHYEEKDIINIKVINENKIDAIFRGTSEVVEEAILNSLVCAETTIGRNRHVRKSLKDYMHLLNFE